MKIFGVRNDEVRRLSLFRNNGMGESLFLFAMVLTNCAGYGEDAIAS